MQTLISAMSYTNYWLFIAFIIMAACFAYSLVCARAKEREMNYILANQRNEIRNLRLVAEHCQYHIQYIEAKYHRIHLVRNQEIDNIARALDPAPPKAGGF